MCKNATAWSASARWLATVVRGGAATGHDIRQYPLLEANRLEAEATAADARAKAAMAAAAAVKAKAERPAAAAKAKAESKREL